MQKIIVCGYARHGKDEVSKLLRQMYGLEFISSSRFVNKMLIYPAIKDVYGYESEEECFENRVKRRHIWFQKIRDYNTPDKSKLGRLILENNDIYCGLRASDELDAIREAMPGVIVVWVDASERKPPESKMSCSITPGMCDHIIDNNGNVFDLRENVRELFDKLLDSKQLEFDY